MRTAVPWAATENETLTTHAILASITATPVAWPPLNGQSISHPSDARHENYRVGLHRVNRGVSLAPNSHCPAPSYLRTPFAAPDPSPPTPPSPFACSPRPCVSEDQRKQYSTLTLPPTPWEHESTKGGKHERQPLEFFRVFKVSCFRVPFPHASVDAPSFSPIVISADPLRMLEAPQRLCARCGCSSSRLGGFARECCCNGSSFLLFAPVAPFAVNPAFQAPAVPRLTTRDTVPP